MIEARDLTKRYGDKTAVDHLSFNVGPGRVTGFLGPNGAGKSTTMRLILGLDRPHAGTATIDGRAYADLPQPLRTVGALLEAKAMHPGRSAYNHLLFLAQTQGLPRSRVDHVLDLVGLREVARKRTGGYSLGMGQRVGIAVAMLGDPDVLLLDEPVNGLDPDGVRWIRTLLRRLADEGRTVFLSSHLMSEMALTADHVIVVGQGRLLRDQSMAAFIAEASSAVVRVRTPRSRELAALLAGPDTTVRSVAVDTLEVEGLSSEQIGTTALENGIVLFDLTTQSASLEDAYMALTEAAVDFRSPTSVDAVPTDKKDAA